MIDALIQGKLHAKAQQRTGKRRAVQPKGWPQDSARYRNLTV